MMFDPIKSPILNLYNIGSADTSGSKHSTFIGLYALRLLERKLKWFEVHNILRRVGFSNDDVESCSEWLSSAELVKLWQTGSRELYPLIRGHWLLLKERAYTDNMAIACAEAWGEAANAPPTDPLDTSHLLQRIGATIWFLDRIWQQERELLGLPEIAGLHSEFKLLPITHYVAEEYASRIPGLHSYEQTQRVIESEKYRWDELVVRLASIVEQSKPIP